MDSINELSELGFINNFTMDKISLVPMIREITLADLKPSVSNCKVMLSSLNTVCLSHGEDISYFKTLFSVIENICRYIEKDEENAYLLFIKNAFSYMEKYRYDNGMRLIITELEKYSKTANDTALLYDCRSSLELLGGNNKKALVLSKKAVSTCVAEENYHLAANLNMNLGYCCHMNGDLISARAYMEQGIEYNSRRDE